MRASIYHFSRLPHKVSHCDVHLDLPLPIANFFGQLSHFHIVDSVHTVLHLVAMSREAVTVYSLAPDPTVPH